MSEKQKERTFLFILFIYFSIHFYLGILPANIDNLLTELSGASNFGVSFIITLGLICITISMLLFGYFSNNISQKIGRKNLFIITNLLWIISIGFISVSPNYIFFIVFYMLAALGNGAFLPVGFSMISDIYGPEQRGVKFGIMYIGLFLGSGLGIVFGGLLGWRLGFLIVCISGTVGILGYFKYAIDPKSTEYNLVHVHNNKITIKTLVDVIRTMDFNTLVDMVRNASGVDGSCFEYIQNIHIRCKELEIKDDYVQKMWEAIINDVPTS